MIDYVIFFGLIAAGIYFYIRRGPAESGPPAPRCESPIEWRLYRALEFNGYHVFTQVPCGRYRIDLALPAYHLAIECDGKAYHSSPDQKARDRRKDRYLRKNGWRVLRFSGSAINRRMPHVLAKIEAEVNKG